MNPSSIYNKAAQQLLRLGESGDQSLGAGNMGAAVLCHSLYRHTQDPDFRDAASSLLDTVSEHIAGIDDIGLESGIAGIGWGVEWLAQQRLIDIDTDEILGELDDELYKAVVFAPDKQLARESGTIGKGMYFLKRFENRNPDPSRYRRICHQECLVILSDEIRERISGNNGNGGEKSVSTFVELGEAAFFCAKLWKRKINRKAMEDVFEMISPQLHAYAAAVTAGDRDVIPERERYKWLAFFYRCYKAGELYDFRSWMQKSQSGIRALLGRKADNAGPGHESILHFHLARKLHIEGVIEAPVYDPGAFFGNYNLEKMTDRKEIRLLAQTALQLETGYAEGLDEEFLFA